MDVQRLSDEKVFLDKQYAKGKQKSSCELTVTNKRVIHSFRYKRGSETTEFKIDEIEGVSLKMKRGSPLGALLLFVGIVYTLYCIFAISGYFRIVPVMRNMGFMMLCLVVAIVMIVIGMILCRKVNFMIIVNADAMENLMFCFSTVKGKNKLIRLKVNRGSAREIINDLYNAVREAKESK